MTKKDFVAFARMIRTQRQRVIHTNNTVTNGRADELLQEQLNSIVEAMANIFCESNPSFDVRKFLDACELK